MNQSHLLLSGDADEAEGTAVGGVSGLFLGMQAVVRGEVSLLLSDCIG